ncbi:hypothetical protein ZIOFF_055323 [Zingiber officinale]|uniref:Uncharacterized protein n=1 Tax=Zingiber officinale TaxID=94328 RepID=A0A8J5FEW1_ZINOF|nr:hypothetical protein ZIOFF_055323 [Zingiber officinale]
MNYVKKEQEGVKDIEFLSGFGMDGFVKPERDGPLEHNRSSPSEHSYTDEEALVDKRVEPEDSVSLLEKKIELEMTKKKGRKKPPKPPRPPNSLPLDATDQKLMKRLKRERIGRMKIKMKNKSTRSNSSLWTLLVTILLILVISWKDERDEAHWSGHSGFFKYGFQYSGLRVHHGRPLLPSLELDEVESEELVPIPPFEEHTGLPVGDPLHDPTVHVERVLGVLHNHDHPGQEKGKLGGLRLRPRQQHRDALLAARPCLCLGRRGVPLDEVFEALFAAWEASGEAEELLFESAFVHADGRRRGRSRRGGERGRRRLFHGGPLELVADASLAVAEAAATHGLREVELGGGGETESGAGQRGGLLEEGGVAREKARVQRSVDGNRSRHGWMEGWKEGRRSGDSTLLVFS